MLKPLKLNVAEAAPAKKSGVKNLLPFEGTAITEYFRLKGEVEERKARMEALALQIKDTGVDGLIDINCENPGNPVSSVKLQDENDPPSRAVVSFTSKYSDVDVAALSQAFVEINERRKNDNEAPVSESDFAQYIIAAKLNLDAFYDSNGNFLENVYAEVRKALDGVAAKLVASGKLAPSTPLYTEEQKARVKPTFHDARWTLGPEDNKALLAVIPNTVTVKASA